jgi:hypothetical protein
LHIVWVVVSPRAAHSFRFPVIRNDVVVIREIFVADSAYPALFDNFPVHQFPHFGGRSEFAVSARVMRIFNSLNSKPDQSGSGHEFPPTAQR